MLQSKLTVALLLLFFVCVALGQTPSRTPPPAPTPSPTQTPASRPEQESAPQADTQQHSASDSTAKWPSFNVYVCWENPEEKYESDMALVRTSITGSWEAASPIRFTGWQKCAEKNRGIRILIDDSGPHTKGLGKRLDGVVNGMVLNFTFNNWSPSCKSMREACVKSIAVHEFGHALALTHEQNRPDTPGECQAAPQGTNPTVLLTPYDPESVMNYCNPVYNNNGVLSKYDKEGIQSLYPEPESTAKPAAGRKG